MKQWNAALTLMALLLVTVAPATAQSQLADHDFTVIERMENKQTGNFDYIYRTIHGTERTNHALNRLSMLSEDQGVYPVPESGCGPTALLNILIWYEKFGLIKPFTREAEIRKYKLKLFNEIDRRIYEKSGQKRTEVIGTSNLDAAIVMDEMVQELSDGRLRLHAKLIEPPYTLDTFLDMIPNFRAGYLVVEPKHSRNEGSVFRSHAVTFIRADRAGYITLGTWGKIYRGILKMRGDEQWFIPSDPSQLELKILTLIQFIPFEPKSPEGRSP
ncbi:MAG: hypothetical protein ACSHX8_02675 [Opitutaceae bacterium]